MIIFFNRIKHILAWLPILWNDIDWDYTSLIRIIEFKLQRMEKIIRASETNRFKDRQSQRIRIVLEHFKRYHDPPGLNVIDNATYENKWSLSRPLIWKTGILFPQHQYRNTDNLSQWHWEQAWKIINKYGRCWWD